MKKKSMLLLAVIAVLLLAVAAGIYWFGQNGTGSLTGTALVCPDGTVMLYDGTAPITMYNRSGKDDLWANVSTGDKIRIVHDGIRETWPGQTLVYACTVLEEGSEGDIPDRLIAELVPYGWLGRPTETGNTVSCSHENVQISLSEMEGWEYEVLPYSEGCSSFGIQFRPAGQSGWIQVLYYPGGFGVCGTGLVTENIGIGTIGTYDDRSVWDFISFPAPKDDFAILSDGIDGWWLQYRTEAFAILHTLSLCVS